MDFLMAFPTHNQRFASSCCHLFDPCWFFSSSWLFQISELTDMVDLYFLFRATEFTRTSKHFLGPCSVSTVVLCFRAIFVTVDRCLPASVLSSDVCATQCNLLNQPTL